MNQNYVQLNNGCKIPQLGLGVFQIPEDADAKAVCLEALKIGYRHIDTAHHYYNERGVGQAVRESGIPRGEIWVTSKLWPNEYGEEITGAAIDSMLERLGLEYIDLILLHQQVGDYLGAWKALEKAVETGKVRSIGLSNFESGRLEEILQAAKIYPAVLQVECHPYYTQSALKERVATYGTKLECWFPLGHGDPKLLNEEVFTALGRKYGKTNTQIILRWHMQMGQIPLPKSKNPQHLRENLDIFDFELTDAEMQEIQKLDQGVRYYNVTLEEQEKRYLNITLTD